MKWILPLIFFAALGRAVGGEFPPVPLTSAERSAVYKQARLTPGARQAGLGCAFYANVPLLTMVSGVNIADGSVASREFVSRIYSLRKGDFQFTSAFDREMFFKLFHIPAQKVNVYYREATRGELLADADEMVLRDLTAALENGCFVSARVLGEFGGPHNGAGGCPRDVQEIRVLLRIHDFAAGLSFQITHRATLRIPA